MAKEIEEAPSKIAVFRGKQIRKAIHIKKRMRGIAVREQLTNEWEKRDVKEEKQYAILTAEISEATFDLKPSEHKELKSLKNQNLRDHMTDLELIFTMLGGASTTEIAAQKCPKDFIKTKRLRKKVAKLQGLLEGN